MFTSTKQRECCLASGTASARQIAAKGGSTSEAGLADRFFDFCICLLQACRQSGQNGHRRRGWSFLLLFNGFNGQPITRMAAQTPTLWGRSLGPMQTRHPIRTGIAGSPVFCETSKIPGSSECGTTSDFGGPTF
jgi:hypothetical protein